VKRLSFPHHVTFSKLVKMLGYCSNVTKLILPTTALNHDQLKDILSYMMYIEKLDIEWNYDIKQLLEVVGANLKEFTIRMCKVHVFGGHVYSATEGWVNYWAIQKFVPQTLNIFISLFGYMFLKDYLLKCWVSSNSKSPPGFTGVVKLYRSVKAPLNLYPFLPAFQLEFGQSAAFPFAIMSSFQSDSASRLLLSDRTHCGKVVCRAEVQLRNYYSIDQINCRNAGLKFVTEFVNPFDRFCTKDLKRLAFTWPNLQRLDIRNNKSCLKSLRGLHAIANYCHNLQGLNLLGIPVTEVEDQTQLWEILSHMKLTHLAVHLCVLLPTVINIQKLTALFLKLTSLQALEIGNTTSGLTHCRCNNDCGVCKSRFVGKNLSVLSHFPSLIHHTMCLTNLIIDHRSTSLQDILTSCKELKCLKWSDHNPQTWKLLPSICCSKLQQIFIQCSMKLSDEFMRAVSCHGGLVHVALCVRSVTSEGIAVLVRNSPNLLTLHLGLNDYDNDSKIKLEELEIRLKQESSYKLLFLTGSYLIDVGHCNSEFQIAQWEREYNTDLFSLWY